MTSVVSGEHARDELSFFLAMLDAKAKHHEEKRAAARRYKDCVTTTTRAQWVEHAPNGHVERIRRLLRRDLDGVAATLGTAIRSTADQLADWLIG